MRSHNDDSWNSLLYLLASACRDSALFEDDSIDMLLFLFSVASKYLPGAKCCKANTGR